MVRRRQPAWTRLGDAELLGLRLKDLELKLEGTALAARIERLQEELKSAGLRFRPHVWLSTDWFTPDGVPGFAVPFYLAHPRLAQLERRQMLEVEGGSLASCMALLRHETAHALDNAYRLRRRKRFREVFGAAGTPYRQVYSANPRSREHVLNLPGWYAQSHPLEDFAETFAVWLQPGGRWRRAYAGWPALAKLEYVDELMGEIARQAPAVRSRRREATLATQRQTLEEVYRAKKRSFPRAESLHESALRQLFSDAPAYRRRESAAAFLSRKRRELARRVSTFTGQHRYTVDQALSDTIGLSRELGLRLTRSERDTHLDAVSLLTVRTLRYTSGGRPLFSR